MGSPDLGLTSEPTARLDDPQPLARSGRSLDMRAQSRSISKKGRALMASSSKKKTTFAKLNRENKLRERRLAKQARKDTRKQEAAERRDAPEGAADVQPAADDS